MAREVSFGVAESGLESNGMVGGIFLLCMIISSLSVISMVIFVCGLRDADGKPKSKKNTSFNYYNGYQLGQDGGGYNDGGHGGHGHGGHAGHGHGGHGGGDGGGGGCGGGCGGNT